MKNRIQIPAKHHIPILEDPVNYYYIPVFRWFFLKRLEMTLSFAQGESLGAVLDIGCASGVLFPELSRRSGLLVGIDTFLQDYSLRGLLEKENITAHLGWGDAGFLPFKDETFDTVVCISTLEHIEDSEGTLAEIKRVMRKRGRLLAGIPVQNLITDKLLGESTGFHVSSHRKILQAAKRIFGGVAERHTPWWAPLDYSLYCSFEGRKI